MKKKFFSKYLLMLTVLMFAIALSGCKGDKSNKNTNKTLTTDDTSSKEPTYGGSVVVGITQDLDSLDRATRSCVN